MEGYEDIEEQEGLQEDQESQEEGQESEARKRQVLEGLAFHLLRKRDEAVAFRAASGIENKWRADEEGLEGYDDDYRPSAVEYAAELAYPPTTQNETPQRSRVVVNIIRGKCELAEGRFSDIMLPTDDKNWGLKETPIPELSEALKDTRQAATLDNKPLVKQGQQGQQQPLTIAEIAEKEKQQAADRMKKMEDVIDDQLNECDYNSELRKIIRNAVRRGTGVLKGPNVVKSLKKKWTRQQLEDGAEEFILEIKEDLQPASVSVDPWDVFPDPQCEEDIHRASYIWERSTILPRELRDLIGVPGYFDDEIIEILQEEPRQLTTIFDKDTARLKTKAIVNNKSSLYEKWEYYGDLDREDIEALGIDVSHDEISQTFSVCCVFVNEKPIKIFLNALDSGDLPYDFFQWTIQSGSPWGVGIPRILMWLQRMIIAAFRAMMDNAGDSAGANIVVGKGIYPVDGRWEITGKKIWRIDDDDELGDVRAAFSQFQIANNQGDLQNIIELVLKFVDLETSLPMMFQSEKMGQPETLGATNIMVDANNVALRDRVKQFDDQITKPHLQRYYDWNMQYNPDNEIKGDYKVDARGLSVLYQKDETAQTLMNVFKAKQDPDINLLVDWEKATKKLFSALRLNIMKSEADLQKAKQQRAKMPQHQDPRIEAAKLKVQGDMKHTQMVQQADQQELQFKMQQQQADMKFKAQQAEQERQYKLAMKKMELQLEMMKLSQEQGISLDKIKADLMRDSMKLKTQVALTQKDGSAPQVTTPPIEPPARARAGHAYTE